MASAHLLRFFRYFIVVFSIVIFHCAPNPRYYSGSAKSYPTKTSTTSEFVSPVNGMSPSRISSGWGDRREGGRMHKAIDITGSEGEQIFAIADGIITFSGRKKDYGNVVEIDHKNGFTSLFAHNQKNLVQKGQKVKSGEPIAKMGNTGKSTGVHLHLEIKKDGEFVNPEKYLR
ncbi:M23 family metallopeptidase [bacterium]|nr:M23 family metallopeptidase [bacterium]MBL7052425.1 M23 family metallopeptidase [Candidatus Neomarinimicrobiota bacterium]